MKRTVLLFVVGLIFTMQVTAQTAQQAAAVIREMTGTVELKTGADWTPAKAGDVVERSTMVSTGF
ncbi:MAG: hypothetical protein LBU66_08275, partial [Treponema sp.]|nr:hypothetical protein [Treponema sp.]